MSAVLEFAPPLPQLAVRTPFARDVLAGLAQPRKRIAAPWFAADAAPFAAEATILRRCAAPIAQLAGAGATLVEIGADTEAAATLFAALHAPAGRATLAAAWDAPAAAAGRRVVVYVPGSTLAYLSPDDSVQLFERILRAAGRNALLVAGADATHDPALLATSYAGTAFAARSLGLLTRINAELSADFSATAFAHRVRYDAGRQLVEIELVSQYTQRVRLADSGGFDFAMGEAIHLASAYAYGLVRLQAVAHRAGWAHRQFWMDGPSRHAVHVLEAARGA